MDLLEDNPRARAGKPPAVLKNARNRNYPSGTRRVDIGAGQLYIYREPNSEEALCFDVIINVAGEVKSPLTTEQAEEKEYVRKNWDHRSNMGEHIKDGERVLVHCREGGCRAATVAIAYVLLRSLKNY
jgi:protein-tyrosine phosphatase